MTTPTAPGKLLLTDNGGGNFTPHEAGSFLGVCVDVIDYGVVQTEYKGQKRQRRLFQFAFETNAELREDGSPQMIWSRRFTASLSEKAAARTFLEAWRGKPFTKEELQGFDPEVVIGVNAMLTIIHREQGGKVYANIASVGKPMKGLPWIEPAKKPDGTQLYVRKKDRTPQDEQGVPPPEPGSLDALAEEVDDLPF